MTEKQLRDAFFELETSNDYFEYKYKNVLYWHLIRVNILDTIKDNNNMGLSMKVPHGSIIREISKYLCVFINALITSGRSNDITNKRPIFLSSNSGMNCFFLKPLLDSMKDKIYINNVCSVAEDDKLCDFGVAHLYLYSLYANCISRLSVINSKCIKKEITNIINGLNRSLDAGINEKSLMQVVKQSVILYKKAYKYYRILLDKCGTKVVVLECGYNIYHYALIAAANDLHIETIEVQHGIADKYCVQYSFLNESYVNSCIPTVFMTFGKYWSDSLRMSCKCKIVEVGSSQFEIEKTKYQDTVKDDKKIVVFTNEYTRELLSVIVELTKKLKDYEVIVKLHSRETILFNDNYDFLERYGIRVIKNELSAYQLMAECKHCIGVSSTTMFEAYEFNDRVYIFRYDGENVSPFTEKLIDYPNAFAFSDAEELSNQITSINIYENILDTFFVKNAKNNLIKEVKKYTDE